MYLFTKIRQLISDKRGVAYLEFFLALPILLLLIVGAIDLTRLVLIHQKIDRVAFTVADVVTQQGTNFTNACPLIAQLNGSVVRDIIRPFNFNNQFGMTVTSIINSDTSGKAGRATPTVEWVYESDVDNNCGGSGDGDGSLSQFMSAQQIATNPAGTDISFAGLERVIVSETYYQFESILPGMNRAINFLLDKDDANDQCVNFNKRFIMRDRNTNPRDADDTFGTLRHCN